MWLHKLDLLGVPDMRHHPDHPRSWREIQPTLSTAEQVRFTTYAARLGFTELAIEPAYVVESLFHGWRTESAVAVGA